jgi:hypothetical protein
MDDGDFLTAVGDLRDLLRDIPQWWLPSACWLRVGEALAAARSQLRALRNTTLAALNPAISRSLARRLSLLQYRRPRLWSAAARMTAALR